jgi:hypothetical protein
MRKLIAGMAVLLLVCLSTVLSGEPKTENQADQVRDYVTALRAELSDGKVNLINTVMKLNVEEAKTFWPIYSEYEKELFTLGDNRMELIKRFLTAVNNSAMDDAQAKTIAADWFKFQMDRLELLKKYNTIITEKLSAVRAAQFVQIEYRVNTVIDLTIAAEMPLAK